MKISLIISAHNEELMLPACLDSIVKTLKETKYDTEVIVVNNASTDRTREIASSYKEVRIINEQRKGLVWARRAGFLGSSGDLIAHIDADTVLPREWLSTVMWEFSTHPDLLALSGPYIYYDAPLATRILVRIFYIFGQLTDKITFFLFKSGSMLQGGNYIIRREALLKIGFDTSIEFYGEDIDIGRRVRKIGKAKWTFKLPMYSSGRRFAKQGLVQTGIIYVLNFIWILFVKKPYSKNYVDIRIPIKN